MTRTRREFILLAGASALGLLAACGGGAPASPSAAAASKPAEAPASVKPAVPASASAKPAASPKASASAAAKAGLAAVKITDIQITSAAGSYIADAKGYFRDEGIQAEFVRMGGGDQIPAIVSGTADVTGTAIAAALYNAFGRDLPLKMVADHGANLTNASAGGFVVRKDLVDSGQYKGPASVKGWKVAEGVPDGTPDVAMDKWLHTAGLSLKDINITYLGFPETLQALTNKAIEATYYQEPFTTIAVDRGVAVRAAPAWEMYPNQQIAVVVFGPRMNNDKGLSQRYVRAYLRGVRDYVKGLIDKDKAKFDEVVPILIEHTTVKQPELFDKAIPSGLRPDGMPNLQSIKDDLDYFTQKGSVKEKFDINKYFDLSFVEQANKDLGPYK
ncbi:MAG TPA: ABC transporter substrate-binding protein [Chloroflexota bacterium]|nr:ABC transporter substrate-binding protein [Chloroflexota bacterium]